MEIYFCYYFVNTSWKFWRWWYCEWQRNYFEMNWPKFREKLFKRILNWIEIAYENPLSLWTNKKLFFSFNKYIEQCLEVKILRMNFFFASYCISTVCDKVFIVLFCHFLILEMKFSTPNFLNYMNELFSRLLKLLQCLFTYLN